MGCQLADELATGFGLRTSASQPCVDVFAEGYAFRLFLFTDRWHSFAIDSAGWGISRLLSFKSGSLHWEVKF